jgi:hypothetical protein
MKSSKYMLSINFIVSIELMNIIFWHKTNIVCCQFNNPLMKDATNLISRASKGLPYKLAVRLDRVTNMISHPYRKNSQWIGL